jgi:hypothetical protein
MTNLLIGGTIQFRNEEEKQMSKHRHCHHHRSNDRTKYAMSTSGLLQTQAELKDRRRIEACKVGRTIDSNARKEPMPKTADYRRNPFTSNSGSATIEEIDAYHEACDREHKKRGHHTKTEFSVRIEYQGHDPIKDRQIEKAAKKSKVNYERSGSGFAFGSGIRDVSFVIPEKNQVKKFVSHMKAAGFRDIKISETKVWVEPLE